MADSVVAYPVMAYHIMACYAKSSTLATHMERDYWYNPMDCSLRSMINTLVG
jgi:hypothetical protein